MPLSHITRAAVFLALAVTLAAPALHAQFTVGRVEGTVLDSSGAVVVGAGVTLRSLETNASRSFVTGPLGFYVFFAVPPGKYQLSAAAPRFVARTVDIAVVTSQTITQNLTLEVGATPTTVTVLGEAPGQLDVSDPLRSTTRSAQEVANLPSLGHNMMSLVHLAPGVTPTNNPRGGSTFGGGGSYVIILGVQSGLVAANGGRARSSSVQLDYTDANDWEGGGFAPGMQAVAPDLLQEFKLLTSNFSAEYGVKSSAQVLMVSKSGSNRWHGTAYEFHQNDALNARDYFDKTGEPTPIKQNIWGFTMGGPLARDRFFLFGGYEGRKTRGNALTSVATVLSESARGAIADPVVQALAEEFLPLPTEPHPSNPDLGRISTQIPSPLDTYQFLLRGDAHLGDRHTLTARYLQSTASFVARFPSQNQLPGFDVDNHFELRNVNLTDTLVFSPRTVNELRFSFSRAGAQGNPQNGVLTPRFQIAGVVNFGALQSVPAGRRFDVWQLNDLLSHSRGKHVLKVGADARLIRDRSLNATNARGVFTFANEDAFIAGQPSNWRQLFGDTGRVFRTALLGFFLQDDWKLAPTLTINLGVRWEIQGGQSEADGQTAILDPETPGEVGQAGAGPLGSFRIGGTAVEGNAFNLAPRVGFAWNPRHGSFVVRGGYGLYWDSFSFAPLAASRAAPPFNYTFSLGSFAGPNSFASILNGTAPILAEAEALVGGFGTRTNFGQVTSVDPRLRNPYVQHFSLTLEQRLERDYIVSLGYVGTKGIRLTRLVPINPKVNGVRLDPRFEQVDFHDDHGSSVYHSLQAEVRKSWSQGLQFHAAYTWSKSIDDGSDFAPTIQANDNSYIQDVTDPRGERAVSNYDIPHRLVVTAAWQLPFYRQQRGLAGKLLGGWSLYMVNLWQAGLPATLMAGTSGGVVDLNRDGNLIPNGLDNTRANCAAGAAFPFGDPALAQDPAGFGFSQPPLGENGSCRRNSIRMNALTNFDWAVGKDLRLGESGPWGSGPWELGLRAEFINVFNTPFLTAQGEGWRTVVSPSFGQYNAAGSPRKAQLGARLSW